MSPRKLVIPPDWPTYVAKAMWQGTSKRLLVRGRDEGHAKERAWTQVSREMGGETCLRIDIVGTSNQPLW